MALVVKQLDEHNTVTLAGVVKMKLTKQAATPARTVVSPFTMKSCDYKAKPASNRVRCVATKKLIQMI